jgi:hypothetical protein
VHSLRDFPTNLDFASLKRVGRSASNGRSCVQPVVHPRKSILDVRSEFRPTRSLDRREQSNRVIVLGTVRRRFDSYVVSRSCASSRRTTPCRSR